MEHQYHARPLGADPLQLALRDKTFRFRKLFFEIVVQQSQVLCIPTVVGPENIVLNKSPLQFSHKTSLSFDGYEGYQLYREKLLLWDAMMTIAPEIRAPTRIRQIKEQSWITAGTLAPETPLSKADISKLLREMDKTFGFDEERLLHNNVSSYFVFVWTKVKTIDEFVMGFHPSLETWLCLSWKINSKTALFYDITIKSHVRN